MTDSHSDGQGQTDRTKHLELIQGVVTRLANNSFLMKGWALTVIVAIYSVAAKDLNWRLAALGVVPALGFWYLDAYYLRQERLFRRLYDETRLGHTDPFSMDTTPYRSAVKLWSTIWSTTLRTFYGLIIVIGLGLTVASLLHDTTPPSGGHSHSGHHH